MVEARTFTALSLGSAHKIQKRDGKSAISARSLDKENNCDVLLAEIYAAISAEIIVKCVARTFQSRPGGSRWKWERENLLGKFSVFVGKLAVQAKEKGITRREQHLSLCWDSVKSGRATISLGDIFSSSSSSLIISCAHWIAFKCGKIFVRKLPPRINKKKRVSVSRIDLRI